MQLGLENYPFLTNARSAARRKSRPNGAPTGAIMGRFSNTVRWTVLYSVWVDSDEISSDHASNKMLDVLAYLGCSQCRLGRVEMRSPV